MSQSAASFCSISASCPLTPGFGFFQNLEASETAGKQVKAGKESNFMTNLAPNLDQL